MKKIATKAKRIMTKTTTLRRHFQKKMITDAVTTFMKVEIMNEFLRKSPEST
jgi:hypothetical protein